MARAHFLLSKISQLAEILGRRLPVRRRRYLLEHSMGMSDQVEVTLMVGAEDEIAPPGFNEQYEAAARKQIKNVRLAQLADEGHDIRVHPRG